MEPSQRWVRARVGGEWVVDSKRPFLVWEHDKYPTYFFPRADVRLDWLIESAQTNTRQFWDLQLSDQLIERAAYTYPNQPQLEGLISLSWHKMAHWYEEEEEVFVHPRDPYKRVDTMPSSRHVQVIIDGVTVAETKRPFLLFETNLPVRYYIPAADVHQHYLTASDSHTQCPYKGTASYWHVTIGDKIYKDYVWYYPHPIPECPKIKELLCFYNEKVELVVDGVVLERPLTAWS